MSTPASFLENLIDACVMECYFREHLAEQNLLVHKTLAAQLNDYNPGADDATQTQYLEDLQNRLQASELPEKLRLIPEKSPELLGVILKEGKA